MTFVDVLQRIIDILRAPLSGVLSQVIVAIVLLLVGFILAKVFGRMIYKTLHSFEINDALFKLTNVAISFEEIAGTFTTYFVYFVTIVIVLQQIGIATTILHMISAGVIIIIVLAMFLGVKDFIPNAIAGLFIAREKIIVVGETIKVKGITGKVTRINLVETKLITKSQDVVHIPNSAITKTEIIKIKQKEKSSKNSSEKDN